MPYKIKLQDENYKDIETLDVPDQIETATIICHDGGWYTFQGSLSNKGVGPYRFVRCEPPFMTAQGEL